MEIPYRIEHRNVKYPRLEFKGLKLLVILPPGITEPSEIIRKRKTWIEKKWNVIQEAIKQAGTPKDGFMIFGEPYSIEYVKTDNPTMDHVQKRIKLDPENPKQQKLILKELKTLLKQKIQPIIEEYAKKIGFRPNKAFIKRQQTKWGSCSIKRNITLNLKLVCLPEQTIKYIIYHELAHLKHKRHDEAFWQIISQEFPDYKQQEKKLLEFWFHTEMLFQNLSKQQLNICQVKIQNFNVSER
ncbi:MAG: SprT family zinc-dependent metalloprotease [Nitrososphaeria archaeon]